MSRDRIASISFHLVDTVAFMNQLPTVTEELKACNLGTVIIGTYYALEFGSLQALYPIMGTLKISTFTAAAGICYASWLLVNSRVRMDAVTVSYLIFCFYLILNAALLTDAPENREAVIKLLVTYLAYYIIASSVIRDLKTFVLLVDILLAFMAYSCLHGMLQGGLLWGSQWLSDENIYAVFCCTGMPFAFVLLLRYESNGKKLCYLVCLSLYVIGVALAASRGGFLAFGVVLFMFWLFSKKKMRGVLAILLFGIVVLSAVPPKVFNEFEQISVDEQEGSAGERTYLWRLGMDMFKEHKIFGVGITNYGNLYPYYDQKAEARDKLGGINWRGHKMVAHSTPVTFLTETGLVGVTLLALLLVNWGRQLSVLVKQHHNDIIRQFGVAAVAAMLAFWVGSLFLTLTVYPFFYNIVILSIVCLNITRNKRCILFKNQGKLPEI